jgi:hypothetical protein
MAFLSLASAVGSIVARSAWLPETPSPLGVSLITVVMTIPLMGLITLFLWDLMVREGKILYEEISDEVEWRHRTFGKRKILHGDGSGARESEEARENIGRPNIEVRVVLRKFLRASTLPFVTGPMSGMVYAIFFISCMIFITMIVATRIGN